MTAGHITAANVNLRNRLNGTILTQLALNTPVVVETIDGELAKVEEGRPGYVSARYVARDDDPATAQAKPDGIPPADFRSIESDDQHAYRPDGQSFARRHGAGFVTVGETVIPEFLAASPTAIRDVSASRLRVIQAVSPNEGKLEAINSYDNAFLSFGVFQWTAGPQSDPGELAALLLRLSQSAPEAFQDYFGRYALDVARGASLRTGFLSLNGQPLKAADQKAQLRSPEWAYRFWRAGHDDAVRACQVMHALGRIEQFYAMPMADDRVQSYVTSEYGVALLLDEHVNRPGHVPGTLAGALDAFVTGRGAADPAAWSDGDEAALLKLYVERRQGTMTDSDNRAQRIADAVSKRTLSAARGSFQS
jgi:hypothetical protein